MIMENDGTENIYRVNDDRKYMRFDKYKGNNENENEYKKNQENEKNESNDNNNDNENIIMIKIIEHSD